MGPWDVFLVTLWINTISTINMLGSMSILYHFFWSPAFIWLIFFYFSMSYSNNLCFYHYYFFTFTLSLVSSSSNCLRGKLKSLKKAFFFLLGCFHFYLVPSIVFSKVGRFYFKYFLLLILTWINFDQRTCPIWF